MLGANVGTALAAQIFSFDVLWLWSADHARRLLHATQA
jgi:Na+/phosphate symporter